MDYTGFNVTELKAELNRRGISTTELWRKEDCIARLKDDDATTNSQPLSRKDRHLGRAEGHEMESAQGLVARPPGSDSVAKQDDPRSQAERSSVQSEKRKDEQEFLPSESQVQREVQRERRRRSTSPALSASTVTKKLEQVSEDPVFLPEDEGKD
ncbi:hypothetical protein C1H76_4819 [Elsinoe australis]|uniref:SAP domain-containing protein n=1 Tax=Elsinoe australis TaxID=40998 RepID=A0A4U7AZM3_9PEZI|nr:hypothetical protein C1H76_4819 [Elsinoe australis]